MYICTLDSEEIVSAVKKMEMKEGDVAPFFWEKKTGWMWRGSYQASTGRGSILSEESSPALSMATRDMRKGLF